MLRFVNKTHTPTAIEMELAGWQTFGRNRRNTFGLRPIKFTFMYADLHKH